MNAQTNQGFTLLELVTTVAIAGVLFAIAVPSFRSMIQNNRATIQAHQFITAVNLARSEAIKRGATVILSAVSAGDNANEWGPGFRIWVDTNGNGTYDSGEELREFSALTGGATLNSVGNLSAVNFLPNGMANLTASSAFQLRVPNCSGIQSRDITLTVTGRVSTTKVTGSCT